MNSVRSLPLVAMLAAATAACSDSTGSGEGKGPPTVTLRAVETSVRVGELASIVKPGGGLTAAFYAGTMGSAAVTFGRMDDSTLAVVVPGAVSPGAVTVQVELGAAIAGGTIQVTAGETIADPDAVVATALDGAATSVRVVAPSTYGGDWAADSALLERELAAARAAFAQLDAADRLAVARLVGSLDALAPSSRRDAAAPAGGLSLAMGATAWPQDAACANQLIGWDSGLGTGEKAAAAAVTWYGTPLKWIVARAFSLQKYVESVLAMGKVGNVCTMEQDLVVDGTPTPDETGTQVEVTADRRTFIDTDALTSEVADRFVSAKNRTRGLFAKLQGLFASDDDQPSAAAEPVQGAVVDVDVPVEPERVGLETTLVTTAEGSSVAIRLVRKGGVAIVEATGEVRQAVRRTLGFSVSRPGFETRTVASDVEIQSVCLEAGQLLPGCVETVMVSPETLEIGVGQTGQFAAIAYDASGKVLNRTITWESSDTEMVMVTNPSGYYQGLKEGGPVTISAITGHGPSMRRGTAQVTVTATDSTEIYERAVLGTWTVALVDGTGSYRAEFREGGDIVYFAPADTTRLYCPNIGTQPVDGYCEYPASWEIVRRDGRYYLYDSGFWHPAFGGEDRDPLTMPPGGFTTYSGYSPGAPSRTFTRN